MLTPRCPQFNGCVERANVTARTEFWSQYAGDLTVVATSGPLADYNHFLNHVRPHRTLDMKTPIEYLAEQAA